MAGLEGWRVVILAEPGGGVAIVLQDAADGCRVFGKDAVVTRIAGGHFRDHAEAHSVVVAPRDKGGPCRRAQRGGMKPERRS